MDRGIEREIAELTKPRKVDLTEKEVDILLALSDNKGHTASELAKSIGSTEPYASRLLGELSSYEFGGWWESYSIEYFHFKDPLALLHKLQDQRDSVSKYIFKNMPIQFKENLTCSDLQMLIVILSYGLSFFLTDAHLYSRERFANVKLSEDAKRLLTLKEKLTERNIRVLNRILIADAYPDEMSGGKISLIHQKFRVTSNKSKFLYFINLDLRPFFIILGHLEYEIRLDGNRLAVMETRLENYIAKYDDFRDPFIVSSPDLEKEIKDGRYDMVYFRKRYMKNINTILNFLTSNYVVELLKKYDYKEKFNLVFPFPLEEFDYEKLEDTSAEYSLEEINDLKQKFNQKFGANEQDLSKK